MAHSATRRILLLVLGAAMLFCVTASGAVPQDRKGAATSVRSGIVKLPIVEKQDIRFLPFSLNGEAPRSRILKFTQDDHGFLWLATTTGLYRYDGYSLKHYLHEPDDPASLSADRVGPSTKIAVVRSGSERTRGSTVRTRPGTRSHTTGMTPPTSGA